MTDQLARLKSAFSDRYAIESELGQGGMATVYLAEDLKHHRKVAVKVLKPELAAILGAERFLKEIEVTANLQHPNILPLYDSGEADTFLFYVMPYVEGDTLRDKIDREKQLPVEDTVEIAKSVAAALSFAHERDVVHRDIKPENILLQSGQALVADFGIALAVTAAGGTRLTETGLSLGTPHYMSPEQATGDRELDARSDVYSLGCVVYEMLVGDPPHTGSTVQAIIAKVLSEDPSPITQTRSLVPPNVDAAVKKAIAKSPADRFGTAAKFAEALTNPAFALAASTASVHLAPESGPWKRLTVALGGLAALFAGVALWALLRPEAEVPLLKLSVALPAGQEFAEPSSGSGLALSADGATLAYMGPNEAGLWQLFARHRDELNATPVGDNQRIPFDPALSPDGREVAYIAGVPGLILVSSVQGGAPRAVFDSARAGGGLDWGSDDALYFENMSGGISRVPAGGGPPEVVSVVDRDGGEFWHRWTDVLPSAKGALFTIGAPGSFELAAVDFQTGAINRLGPGFSVRYAATGHVVWTTEEGALMAAPFDERELELTGPAVEMLQGVSGDPVGAAHLALSETGTLVYSTGSTVTLEPAWVGRDGTPRDIDPGWRIRPNVWISLALSPDGKRLAVTGRGASGLSLWIKQLDMGPLSRLTFEGEQSFRPAWTPDGRSVIFVSDRGRGGNDFAFWRKRADGSGVAELVMDDDGVAQEGFFSHDGTWFVYRVGAGNGRDIYARRLGLDSAVTPLLTAEFEERSPTLSPDDRWLAYMSNESGRDEVYVRPFPNVADGRWQVSTEGGFEPVWAHNGTELFYRNGANELVVAQVTTTGSTFSVGQQRVLFSMTGFRTDPNHPSYDVSPDDQRFVMFRTIQTGTGELIWIENWFAELKEKVGN